MKKMIEIETTVRRWGNSFGVIIPKEIVEDEKLENKKIKLALLRDNKVLKETFGILKGKLKQSAQEIKDEMRRELYDD